MALLPPPDDTNQPSLARYLRLYGIHLVEQSVSTEIVLRVRVATTRYITRYLPTNLDNLWRKNPEEGVAITEEIVLTQLNTLRQTTQAWDTLGIAEPLLDEYVQNRTARRQLPNLLPTSSALMPHRPLPTLNNPLVRRVDKLNQILVATHTAITVADAALKLWQDWKLGQSKIKVAEARQILLEDAIRATEASQNHALQQALDPSYVEHYLASGGDDPAYDILFGDIEEDE